MAVLLRVGAGDCPHKENNYLKGIQPFKTRQFPTTQKRGGCRKAKQRIKRKKVPEVKPGSARQKQKSPTTIFGLWGLKVGS